MSEEKTLDTFDRILGAMHGLPDVDTVRPSTVMDVLPIIGRAQTYIVRTYRAREGGAYHLFLQMVDAEGRERIVVPPKVAAAIYRQREQLVTKVRRRRGKEQAARRRHAPDGPAVEAARLTRQAIRESRTSDPDTRAISELLRFK